MKTTYRGLNTFLGLTIAHVKYLSENQGQVVS